MSDLWDYESRWETSTRTDGGYYDQVIALSQGLINENFKKLYDIYKADLGKVYLKDAAIGTFEGEVEAPRILIPGADEPSANLNEVIFQIRSDAPSAPLACFPRTADTIQIHIRLAERRHREGNHPQLEGLDVRCPGARGSGDAGGSQDSHRCGS